VISNEGLETGQGATSSVGDRSKSATGRSESPEAKRSRLRREARKQDGGAVGGRGGSEPSTKGNPIPPGPRAIMGEPISAAEAKEQLLWGHIGLAKIIRADIDLAAELDEEFTVAGKNYAAVANHIFPPMRVAIRFIAPVVLVAVMLVIWGHMIAATPWVDRIRDWWQRRHEDERPPAPYVAQTDAHATAPVGHNGAAPPEPPAPPPAIPPRPNIRRRIGRRL
jgi:hypothetical protein